MRELPNGEDVQIRLLREQFSEFLDPGVRVLHRRGMNFVERSYNVLVIAIQKGILMACAYSLGIAILQRSAEFQSGIHPRFTRRLILCEHFLICGRVWQKIQTATFNIFCDNLLPRG